MKWILLYYAVILSPVFLIFALAACQVNYQPVCSHDCQQGDLGDQSL